MMAAQFKAGKTTLGIDLSACLATDHDFLDYFEVNDLGGNVGYWNLEVDEPQMYEWQNRRIKKGSNRVYTAHLRGHRMNLLHEATADWTINWLKDRDIANWIIDPLGRLLDDENDFAGFSRWFTELERIVYEAEVRMALIMHHSGHAGVGMADSIPRSRGASSMLGNTDANIGYRHGGELGSMPPSSRRYMSALGRGVEVWPELTLDYDPATGRLHVVEDAPGREADKREQLSSLAVDAVTMAGDWVLNYTTLKAAIGGNTAKCQRAISEATSQGKIITKTEGKGKATLYALPQATTKTKLP